MVKFHAKTNLYTVTSPWGNVSHAIWSDNLACIVDAITDISTIEYPSHMEWCVTIVQQGFS